MPSSKFDQFNITDVEYKKINGHAIETSILVPKAATDGNRPVPILVHFHGGGLVLGSRLFEPWFSNWYAEDSTYTEQKISDHSPLLQAH